MPSSDNRGWPQGARSKGRPPQLPQPIPASSGTALLHAKLRGLLPGLFFPYQLSCPYFGQTSPELFRCALPFAPLTLEGDRTGSWRRCASALELSGDEVDALIARPRCRRAADERDELAAGAESYFFSKKISLQSALPVFSAECEAMAGRAPAVPALLSISVVLP